jgi:hypothetical protein
VIRHAVAQGNGIVGAGAQMRSCGFAAQSACGAFDEVGPFRTVLTIHDGSIGMFLVSPTSTQHAACHG